MPRRLFLAVCAFAIIPALAACGGAGGDDADAATQEATPTESAQVVIGASTATPVVGGPASKYSITLDDIGIAWLTDIKETLVIDTDSYANTRDVFENASVGHQLLAQWGYKDGYQTAFIPEGRDDAVLKGAYYIVMEVHRFETVDGARAAYQYYHDSITEGGAPAITPKPIGNQAVAFTGIGTKIPRTTVNSQFEQIILQRGNVVAIVLATGAQGFMKAQYAWDLAKIVDEKLLGERAAIEPTPTSNYQTPTPAPRQ